MSAEKLGNFLLTKGGRWLLFLTWCLFITHLWLPRTWSLFGQNDWDLTYTMFEVARKSIVEFHQWPQWNPWLAFGSDLNANPQAGHVSVFFLPILAFGTFYGYKVSILLAMVAGCFGSYHWFRSFNENKLTATCGALIFCSANYFSSHVFQAGHSNVLYLYLLPWLALSLLKQRNRYHPGYLLLAVLIAAQFIAGGAPIVFIIGMAFIALMALGDLWANGNRNLMAPVLFIAVGAVLLTLWKLLPGIELWRQTPRLVKDPSGINLVQWLESLCGYDFRTGTWHANYEYRLGFPLILTGVVFYYRNQINHIQKWLLLLLILLWFCLGNSPSWINPWYWLNQYVPPFSSIRAPSRFGILVVFALCTALIYVIRNADEKRLIRVLLICGAISQGLAFHAESSFMSDTPILDPASLKYNSQKLPEVINQPKVNHFLDVKQNRMILNAYEPLNLSVVNDSFPIPVKGGGFNIFTPNFMEINVKDSLSIINMRYSKNWSLFGPGEIKNHKGHLAISAHSGVRIINYHNPLFSRGLKLSLLFFPFLLLSHLLFSKKRK